MRTVDAPLAMTDFARTPAERKRKQWAERQRRQRIRDALALTDDRGGLVGIQGDGTVDRTGRSIFSGIKFLKGGLLILMAFSSGGPP